MIRCYQPTTKKKDINARPFKKLITYIFSSSFFSLKLKNKKKEKMSSIFIGRLPLYNFDDRDLEGLFDKFGKITDIKMKRGLNFGK